jgi:carbon storage regulator CsrA
MLTLSRKVTETIHIGEEITVTIKRIGPMVVQVGIEAPASYRIRRGEHFRKPRPEDCLADRGKVKAEDN